MGERNPNHDEHVQGVGVGKLAIPAVTVGVFFLNCNPRYKLICPRHHQSFCAGRMIVVAQFAL